MLVVPRVTAGYRSRSRDGVVAIGRKQLAIYTRRRWAALLLFSASSLFAAGCTGHDEVTINYEQIGACNGFNNGSGATSAGPKAAYVVFRISTIANTDTQARTFDFDPNRLFINVQPRAYTSTQLNLAQLNPFYATSRTVAAGATEALNGAVIAVVPTVAENGASEANNTNYFLLYDGVSGTQGIVLVKANPQQTSWPQIEDCTRISY